MPPVAPSCGVELRQHRLDPVDHRHGVGAGLALDRQHQRALAVEPAGLLRVLDRIDHPREVAQADRVVVAGRRRSGRGRRPRRRAGSAPRWSGSARRPGPCRRACWRWPPPPRPGSRRRRCRAPPERRDRAGSARRIAGCRRPAPGRRRRWSTGPARSPAARRRRASAAAWCRCQRQQQDRRVGRVELAVARRRGHLDRQLALRARDRRLDVGRRLVDVAVELELDRRSRSIPAQLVVLICWIAGMVENCLMSGVATALAMVSGEAPGSWARDRDRREIDLRQRRHRQLA